MACASDGTFQPQVGHTRNIAGLAFAGDGTTLVSGGYDARLCTWDTRSLLEGRSIAFSAPVGMVAMDPTGHFAAVRETISGDGLTIFDAANLHMLMRVLVPPGIAPPKGPRFLEIAIWSPDGNMVARNYGNRTILVQSRSGATEAVLNEKWPLRYVAFDPGGRELLVGSDSPSGEVDIFDTKTWVQTRRLSLGEGSCTEMGFVAPHRLTTVTTVGRITSARLWDTSEQSCRARIELPAGVQVAAYGKGYFVIGYSDGRLQCFDANLHATTPPVPTPHQDAVLTSVAISVAGGRVASAYDDDLIQLWSMPSLRPVGELKSRVSLMQDVSCSSDETHFAVSTPGAVYTWNSVGGPYLTKSLVGLHQRPVISPNMRSVAELEDDGSLGLTALGFTRAGLTSGERSTAGSAPGGSSADFSSAVASKAGIVMSSSSQVVRPGQFRLGIPGFVLRRVTYSANGTWIGTLGVNRRGDVEGRVWGVVDGALKSDFGLSDLGGLAIRSDGVEAAVVVGEAERLILIKLAHPETRLTVPLGHTSLRIPRLVYSPSGKFLAISSDATLLVWDAVARRVLWRRNQAASEAITCLSFRSDDKVLGAGSDDSGIVLWNARTGAPVARLSGHTDTVTAIAFTTSGKGLVSSSTDGTAIVWDYARRRPLATFAVDEDGASLTLLPSRCYAARKAGSWLMAIFYQGQALPFDAFDLLYNRPDIVQQTLVEFLVSAPASRIAGLHRANLYHAAYLQRCRRNGAKPLSLADTSRTLADLPSVNTVVVKAIRR